MGGWINPPDSLSTETVTNSSGYVGPLGFPSFGKDEYEGAGFLEVRRSGWSWPEESFSNVVPFCYGGTCFDSTHVCEQVVGSFLSNKHCLLPPKINSDVSILGPTCWQDTCYTGATKDYCSSVGGINVQDRWCILTDGKPRTVIGPTCFGRACQTEATHSQCQRLDGTLLKDRFCILDRKATVVGPACYEGSCFAGSLTSACDRLGGARVGNFFCVVEDPSPNIISVLGPTCHGEMCYTSATNDVCRDLDGINIANRFCIVSSTEKKYTMLGPFCFGESCYTSDGVTICSALGGRNIGGAFCIVEGEYSQVGPVCWDGRCFPIQQTCLDAGGRFLGEDHFCVLEGRYDVVGPTCSGDGLTSECLTSVTAEYCTAHNGINFADRFCAIDGTPKSGTVAHLNQGWFVSALVIIFVMKQLFW